MIDTKHKALGDKITVKKRGFRHTQVERENEYDEGREDEVKEEKTRDRFQGKSSGRIGWSDC